MGRLKDHIGKVGSNEALRALGEDKGEGAGQTVGYTEANYWMDSMGEFTGAYLGRYGIVPVASLPSSEALKVSPFTTEYEDFKPDFKPTETVHNDKLEESKDLPGLETSEDISVVMGKDVTHLTPEVIAKMDERYGKGGWLIKTYSEENAFAGFGIFFPQRATQVMKDAQTEMWNAGSALSKYGFKIARNPDTGAAIGLQHETGDTYQFGTPEYEETIHGDARHWGDRASTAAAHEQGMMLPNGGKKFMAQPAFPVVGVTEEERAQGKTIVSGEGRVHVVIKDGKASVIPHSTWIKGADLPIVFDDDDTRAMAKAAEEAINKLPEGARKGQLYAPDVVKTKDGYRVVELNASVDQGGGSGYLQDNPFVIDSYVSHLTGREPGHVQFIRKLLSAKKKAA